MLRMFECCFAYSVFFVFALYTEYIYAEIHSTDIIRNLTVFAVKDTRYLGQNAGYNSLKLNISWLPIDGNDKLTSYSVIVSGISNEDKINATRCPEESLFYTTPNNTQYNVLLPQNYLMLDIPEMSVYPNCTYKVEVYGNPRKKMHRSYKVIYTVPGCVDQSCGCLNAEKMLPIPVVQAFKTDKDVLITWNVTSDDAYIDSYIISIGVPLLVSKAGFPVYNYTKITTVSMKNITSFLWKPNLNERHYDFKTDFQILVIPVDTHGCNGKPGEFFIKSRHNNSVSQNNTAWLAFCGFIGICVIIILSYVSICGKRKYKFTSPNGLVRKRRHISKCKSDWAESLLQNRNVLYVEHNEQEIMRKNESDAFIVPYKSVSLIRELGKGQFGTVYLGTLDDSEKTPVAVKMSHSTDSSNILEARKQFMEEIEIMKIAGIHSHLVRLIGYCALPNEPICIILEYMEGGDLLAYLRSKRKTGFIDNICTSDETLKCTYSRGTNETSYTTLSSEISSMSSSTIRLSKQYSRSSENSSGYASKYVNISTTTERQISKDSQEGIDKIQFVKFSLDIARGMEHLEAKGIIHRDLAARNVLVTSDLTLKISDFGLSRNGIYVMNTVPGTVRHLPIRWMSPEALRDRAFSSKSDIWSFAIVLWEIGTLGAFPYPDIRDDRLLRHIIHDGARLEKPDSISNDIYDIMSACWSSRTEDRPTFKQIVSDLKTVERSLNLSAIANNPCYSLLT